METKHTPERCSAELIAFLKAWYDWATDGGPDGGPFSRATGLCFNLQDRFDHPSKWDTFLELNKVLGEEATPFGQEYYNRGEARTQHECPKRLAWVRERLVEAGEIEGQ